jgi:hypothetical protein
MRGQRRVPTDFEKGLLVGVLIGEGHFGGDGRQPQVTLRMHARHEALFDWIVRTFPGGKLYGPYFHGGRHYLQWMARGNYLREVLLPVLDQYLTADLDNECSERYEQMKALYRRQLQVGDIPEQEGGTGRQPDGGPGRPANGQHRSRAKESTEDQGPGEGQPRTDGDGRPQSGAVPGKERLTAAQVFERMRRGTAL